MTLDRHGYFLLFLAALTLGLAFQGTRGLYETTEGRYAEAGREMLETGDWWVPQLDYQPHWSKPPLTYWTVAAGIAAAGPTALGARLGNAIAFPFLVVAVAWLGTLLWDRRTGLLAGLVYATSAFPLVAASTISTDLVLTLWEVLMAALYWQALRSAGERTEARWVLAFWTTGGLAFLTKGPPGLLTLLAVVIFHGIGLRQGRQLPRLARAPGLLAFFVLGFGWYLDVVIRTPGLLGYFLGDELLDRIATDRHHRNPEWYMPPFVYGLPLLLGLGGWLLQLGPARLGWSTGGLGRPVRQMLAGGPIRLFLSLWLLVPLLILSLSMSRLPLYVLPFFAVLPLALARGLTWALSDEALRRRVTWTAGAMAALLIVLKGTSALVPSRSDMSRIREAIRVLAPSDSPRVIAVDEEALYGLQFYLHGMMDRTSSRAVDTGSQSPLEAVAMDLVRAGASAGPPPTPVVLVRRGGPEVVESVVCARPGLHCQETDAGEGWRLWLVTPAGDN